MSAINAETRPGWAGLNTSLGLLERVQARDEAAWQRLIVLYSPLVDYWCRIGKVPEQEWPDIRQELFLAVSRNIGDFRRDSRSGAFRAWLRAVARNKIADFWRGRLWHGTPNDTLPESVNLNEVPAPELDAAEMSAEAGIVYRQALALIQQSFESSTWRAFWAVVIESRTASMVAAELDVSLNAVYLAKARVMRRLREEFADLLEREFLD